LKPFLNDGFFLDEGLNPHLGKNSKKFTYTLSPRPDESEKLCEQKHTATSWKKRQTEALLQLKVE